MSDEADELTNVIVWLLERAPTPRGITLDAIAKEFSEPTATRIRTALTLRAVRTPNQNIIDDFDVTANEFWENWKRGKPVQMRKLEADDG